MGISYRVGPLVATVRETLERGFGIPSSPSDRPPVDNRDNGSGSVLAAVAATVRRDAVVGLGVPVVSTERRVEVDGERIVRSRALAADAAGVAVALEHGCSKPVPASSGSPVCSTLRCTSRIVGASMRCAATACREGTADGTERVDGAHRCCWRGRGCCDGGRVAAASMRARAAAMVLPAPIHRRPCQVTTMHT
jgi:hypothetical protein